MSANAGTAISIGALYGVYHLGIAAWKKSGRGSAQGAVQGVVQGTTKAENVAHHRRFAKTFKLYGGCTSVAAMYMGRQAFRGQLPVTTIGDNLLVGSFIGGPIVCSLAAMYMAGVTDTSAQAP
jgi:hypothetical protein